LKSGEYSNPSATLSNLALPDAVKTAEWNQILYLNWLPPELPESSNLMNTYGLRPRKRIAFSTFIPARLARPPFSARQEGGPERLAMAGRRKVLK
jgi:hypothetical protein